MPEVFQKLKCTNQFNSFFFHTTNRSSALTFLFSLYLPTCGRTSWRLTSLRRGCGTNPRSEKWPLHFALGELGFRVTLLPSRGEVQICASAPWTMPGFVWAAKHPCSAMQFPRSCVGKIIQGKWNRESFSVRERDTEILFRKRGSRVFSLYAFILNNPTPYTQKGFDPWSHCMD